MGGGRAAHVEMAFSKVVILEGRWIGGRAAEGRRRAVFNLSDLSAPVVARRHVFSHSEHFDSMNHISERNEYEIVDIIKEYKFKNTVHHEIGRGTAWFDMGTTEAFYNCSSFVRTIQERQGMLVCSPHEIAYRNEWINLETLENYIQSIKGSEYSENLSKILIEN